MDVMKRFGITLFAVGSIGFLIGGAGLDGPTWVASAILAVVSFLVAAVGYKFYEKLEGSETESTNNNEKSERGEKNQTGKKVDTKSKEATFQVWLTVGKLDVPVRR